MFWRRKRYNRNALPLLSSMSEQERFDTRCIFVTAQIVPIHLMTANDRSVKRHAERLTRVGAELGLKVARLQVDLAEDAMVLIGSIDSFMAAFQRGQRPPKDAIAVVEGEPPPTARAVLQHYESIKIT